MNRRALLPGIFAVSLLTAVSGAAAQTPKGPDTTTTKASDSMSGHHEMTGEVTKVDAKKGWVDIKTSEGSMKLHFPPDALQNVKKGDNVTVDLGMTHVASAKSTGRKTSRSSTSATDTAAKTK
jgi:phosphopentomutase